MSATIVCKNCGTQYGGNVLMDGAFSGKLVVSCGPCPICAGENLAAILKVYSALIQLAALGKIDILDIDQVTDYLYEHSVKLMEGLQ